MASSLPGLFQAANDNETWLSSSVSTNGYCSFAEEQFQPFQEIQSIPPLPDMTFCHNMAGYFEFLDTAIQYEEQSQTGMSANYDFISTFPHTLISENVILVVSDRLNPSEVKELIDRLANIAEKTKGTFTFRNGKLFGNLIIVVNNCQDWGR